MAPQFRDYFGEAALRPVPQIPRTLDQVAEMYFRQKTLQALEQKRQSEESMQLLEYGFRPQDVTPQTLAQAHGPETSVESPAIGAMRDYLSRRGKERDLKARKTEAEISKISATPPGLHPVDETSPFYTDPNTGMMFRIKPGHKGSEYIPLPGQAIGPDGRVVFTADRADEGKMLPPAQVIALNEGKNVARLLPEVEAAIRDNESLFGPVAGRVGSANPYSEQSQTVDARMRTASQAFGRFMEGGVLRKEDEEKYRAMFPQLKDTPKVARNKLAIVRRQLAQKYEDDRKALGASKYDVSGFEALQIPPSIFREEAPTPGVPAATPATQNTGPAQIGRFKVEVR